MNALKAPVILNLELTTECPYACSHCYKQRYLGSRSLRLERMKEIILDASAVGVKKILLSGGEPMLYDHLYDVLQLCKDHQIYTCLSTGGYSFQKDTALKIKEAGLGLLYVSLNGSNESVNRFVRDGYQSAIDAIIVAGQIDMPVRVNWVATENVIDDIKELIKLLKRHNVKGIDVLRYKPFDETCDAKYSLKNDSLERLAEIIKKSDFDIAVESCYFELRQLLNMKITNPILKGCSAGRYSLTCNADGFYQPCSHVEGKDNRYLSISDYWRKSKDLVSFRENNRNLPGCEQCAYSDTCLPCLVSSVQCGI